MNAKFTSSRIPSLQGFGPSTANCMDSTLAFFSPSPKRQLTPLMTTLYHTPKIGKCPKRKYS